MNTQESLQKMAFAMLDPKLQEPPANIVADYPTLAKNWAAFRQFSYLSHSQQGTHFSIRVDKNVRVVAGGDVGGEQGGELEGTLAGMRTDLRKVMEGEGFRVPRGEGGLGAGPRRLSSGSVASSSTTVSPGGSTVGDSELERGEKVGSTLISQHVGEVDSTF